MNLAGRAGHRTLGLYQVGLRRAVARAVRGLASARGLYFDTQNYNATAYWLAGLQALNVTGRRASHWSRHWDWSKRRGRARTRRLRDGAGRQAQSPTGADRS